jgi:energy-coupling factor transporter ATP-binding protein EcfA2
MKHTFFEVWNFKGIEHIKLDFSSHPQSNIYTLIGLNESGKTTILEALNFFTYKHENLDPLNQPGYSIRDVHDLIPIAKRANFNGEIKIEVGLKLDDDDKQKIVDYCWKEFSFEIRKPLPDEFSIRQSHSFKDSELIPDQPTITWIGFLPWGKSKRAKNEGDLNTVAWKQLAKYMRQFIPSVLYFSNFLFEIPDKIYLESSETDDKNKTLENKIHEFYRKILQDVLYATGENINLKTHILDRAKDGGRIARNNMDSVLLKMGSHISMTVFSNWNKIFKRTTGRKEITVPINYDEENKAWYLQLRLKDGSEYYSISERSLGFRWFFAFLLLTHYRDFRKDTHSNVLFLFDEPASNLHSTAQSQLLDSFAQFPLNQSIVYTTHSHHMINPKWLEGAFVVKNEGLDYDDSYENYNAINTKITLHKYREFAAKHPKQSNYFQPILDVLDYYPSQLENVPDVVMLEGKNDFYTLKFINEKVLKKNSKINLMPGTGAGSLDDVIRLYIAWGRNFVVLLDSDVEGKTQKDRYENEFGVLVKGKIFSLEDINSSWKKKTMEGLFTESEKLKIQKSSYPTTKFNKTHFNRAIQEAYLTNNKILIAKSTKANFERIINFCKEKLKD